jgi:hypothetical protein
MFRIRGLVRACALSTLLLFVAGIAPAQAQDAAAATAPAADAAAAATIPNSKCFN